jgi:hypothetical protein
MAQIIKNYTSIKKYYQDVNHNPEELKPDNCSCGCSDIWYNGLYKRAVSGRDKDKQQANPVSILRFKCSQCKNHYSVLPSIIPLFRWYLWCMQQWVLSMILNGFSMKKAAESAGINRRTVSRWSSWLINKFKMICNIMCESDANFIQYQSEKDFLSLFHLHDLSKIAELLHQEKLLVPY